VLTAHPTEVQRKSILDAERGIAQPADVSPRRHPHAGAGAVAISAAKDALTPRELAANETQIRARVMQLWQTRLLRFTKLTVADEVENALSYYEATFLREIPKVYADPGARARPRPPGRPFPAHGPMDRRRPRWQSERQRRRRCPTHCGRQSEVALRHYLTEVHYLGGELSVSAMLVDCLARDAAHWRSARPTPTNTVRTSPTGAR
jgi:phosphoenolpyruvate carboxylase